MTIFSSWTDWDRSRHLVNFFGQLTPWIKAFKMDLRLLTEHPYQGFTRAFSHVSGACWTWQSWVCWQRRCPLVWTLPAAPAVLWSWLPTHVPAGILLRLPWFVPSQQTGKGDSPLLGQGHLLHRLSVALTTTPMAQKCWQTTIRTTRMVPFSQQGTPETRHPQNTKWWICVGDGWMLPMAEQCEPPRNVLPTFSHTVPQPLFLGQP